VLGHTSIKGFKGALPFAICVVELDEESNLRFVARSDTPIATLRIGLPMEVGFEKVSNELWLPVWRSTPVPEG
jgi:uncharacterized OB-fold protein